MGSKRNTRRRRKKKCTCGASTCQVIIPCGFCLKKMMRKQRRDKNKQYRAKQERSKAMSEAVSDTRIVETEEKRKPTFAVVGTTIFSVLPSESVEMFSTVKEWLETGSLTDLAILAPNIWSRHAKRHLQRILEARGADWLWDHIVFQWPNETYEKFILRVCNAYDVTHFFDVSREPLRTIAISAHHRQQLFQYRPGFDGWVAVKSWITKTSPTFVPVHEQAEEAAMIVVGSG